MNCRFAKPLSQTPPSGWTYFEARTGYFLPWGDGTLSKAIQALVLHRRGNQLPGAEAQIAQVDIIRFTCEQLVASGRAKGWCQCGGDMKAITVAPKSGGCAVCGGRKARRGGPRGT